jgi:murein tripeptide amidase MpaA
LTIGGDPHEKPAIMIDGAHHSRELSSISMTIYATMNILYDYVKGDNLDLLKQVAIIVIPVVNVDGFTDIGQ